MENIDFTDLEANARVILPEVVDIDLHSIEKWILKELQQIEINPEISQQFQKVRKRIRDIEHKALTKLGKKEDGPLKYEGAECSFCSGFESDVELMVRLSKKHNICNECVVLIREVIEEGGG